MSNILKFVFLVSLILWSDITVGCANTPTTFECVKLLYVVDGDTIKVDIKDVHPLLGSGILVRISGIDSPEIHSKRPCERKSATEARRFVEDMLLNAKQIDLTNVQRDKYFRILSDVLVDGDLVSAKILKKNLAVAYSGETKKKWKCVQK